MAAVICGSLAFDTIMSFEGRFEGAPDVAAQVRSVLAMVQAAEGAGTR